MVGGAKRYMRHSSGVYYQLGWPRPEAEGGQTGHHKYMNHPKSLLDLTACATIKSRQGERRSDLGFTGDAPPLIGVSDLGVQ